MTHTHLGHAFRFIAKGLNDGCEQAEKIAHALRNHSEGQLRTLNNNLSFTFGERRTQPIPGESRASLLDARKAGELLKRITQLSPVETTSAEDWAGSSQRGLVGTVAGRLGAPQPGPFFAPSFLIFGKAQDRTQFTQAWAEAKTQLQAGRYMLTVTHYPTADNLVRRWFGTSDDRDMRATKKTALKIIDTIIDGMASKPVMVCYRGTRVEDDFELKENGGSHEEMVKTETGWGWSSPEGGNHSSIGWGRNFFDANTSNQPTELRDPSPDATDKMMVTRAGAVIHELSHRFAKTKDVKLTEDVYHHLKKDVPAQRHIAYGARGAQALAKVNPELAVDNADNYRMFCEDAFAIRARG